MKNIIKWIVTSSANPEAASMTIKGILLQYVSLLMLAASFIKIPITETQLYGLITEICGVVGMLVGTYGAIRKIYYEIKALRK